MFITDLLGQCECVITDLFDQCECVITGLFDQCQRVITVELKWSIKKKHTIIRSDCPGIVQDIWSSSSGALFDSDLQIPYLTMREGH